VYIDFRILDELASHCYNGAMSNELTRYEARLLCHQLVEELPEYNAQQFTSVLNRIDALEIADDDEEVFNGEPMWLDRALKKLRAELRGDATVYANPEVWQQ